MTRTAPVRSKTSQTGAPVRRSRPAPPLTAVKADPLSEDDFEEEAKLEAKEYTVFKNNRSEIERIKDENKHRKREGRELLKVPKAMKQPRKSAVHHLSSEAGSSESDGEGRSYDDDMSGRQRPKKRKRQDADDNLAYEGQVTLPFNPLYALAGIKDPAEGEKKTDQAKKDLLAKHLHGILPPQDQQSTATTSKMTMRNGILMKREDADRLDQQSTADVQPQVEEEEEEEEEAPEGDYEETEEIIVPWGDAIGRSHSLAEDESGEVEEEGVYSDDERFNSSSLAPETQSQRPLYSQSQNEDLPPCRPVIPFTKEQAMIGPYPLDEASPDIAVPAPINKFLKEYQRAGTKFMYDKYKNGTGGILGDDMGLGKTIQVISFLSAIMRKTGTREDYRRRKDAIRQSQGSISPKHWPTALIICPSSLVRNWDRELDRWGYFEYVTWQSDNWQTARTSFQKGFFDIVLASYETVRNTVDHLKDLPWSVVIVDEAHRLKQPRASRTLACKKIQCSSCFALTGTLIQNRMEEMWSVLDFVQRGWAGTLKEWREFAVNPIKRGHRHEGTVNDVVTGIMRLGVVYERILPKFYLRRDKRLIAHELPEKRDMVVFCPLASRQIDAYQRLIDSEDVQFILRRNDPCPCESGKKRIECCFRTTPAGEALPEVVLKNISALGKVANHFGLLYPAKDDSPHTREVNERFYRICTGHGYDNKEQSVIQAALDPDNCGKWKLLEQLLRQWRSEPVRNKVLIFSNSVRLLKMISEFISTSLSGFSAEVFTGEVGKDERMAMVDRFQDLELDHFILLISTQAGGVGLNLTAANKVVIFDPDWNPANDLQAMDRAFRIGQQRTVDVYRLIGQGTLEELKYERQIHKQQRSRQLNEGTFERRIHQGMEGARNEEDQGELFGTHNIFRFDPNGFVAGNLERIRMAEDKFAQDLIEAEYDEEGDEVVEAYGSDGEEVGKLTKNERKSRDQKRAALLAARKRNEESILRDVIGKAEDGGEQIKNEGDILQSLGVMSHLHDSAFKDSPEERKIYEIGVKLLRENPDLAKKIKANDLGKLSRKVEPRVKTEKHERSRLATHPDDEPWKARVQAGKSTEKKRLLAELSD